VIKLLVADDSALMRKLLEGIFAAERDFEIRFARNGLEALDLARTFDPDVVTLDVQMPEMDGLICLARMMIETPRPVVMFSSLTDEGAEATLEAMDLGAVDFIAKPSGAVSLEMDRFGPLLVEKVRCAANVRISQTLRLRDRIRHQLAPRSDLPVPRPRKVRSGSDAVRGAGLVLIGSSTGGPAALDVLLPQLPHDFAWPVLVAQHMPSNFTGLFAKRLNTICELEVLEVTRPMVLLPGQVYIGRGDADLVISSRAGGLSAVSVPARLTIHGTRAWNEWWVALLTTLTLGNWSACC
jgi:two-component system, chemotaxis family, protein-glutamate methylesterase/glutaminase